MGRLKTDLLERVESFCDRVLDVATVLEKKGVSRRIVDQLTGSGTSVGANLFEADEAMSRADFCKCVCVAIKELNESLFWLRLVVRRGWVSESSVESLREELSELKLILGTIVSRTRRSGLSGTAALS